MRHLSREYWVSSVLLAGGSWQTHKVVKETLAVNKLIDDACVCTAALCSKKFLNSYFATPPPNHYNDRKL